MFADDLARQIKKKTSSSPSDFQRRKKYGHIKHEEMFEIFNMGVGLMLAVKLKNIERIKELLDEPVYEIGRIVKKRKRDVIIK